MRRCNMLGLHVEATHDGTMRVVSDDGREVIATDEEITSAAQLQTLPLDNAQHLNLSFNALTSLHGLDTATHLRNLNVSHNALTSLRGVESLTQLRLLRCHSNQISDLSWLASLPHLEELWMHDNQVEMAQIAHLAAIPTLQTLILHPNPCTNTVNYVSNVVKTVPWLSRVDLVEVDEPLRQRSQHVDERELLSSAASDVSEISLMTSRSDGSAIQDNQQPNTPASKETDPTVRPPSTASTTLTTSSSSSSADVNITQKKPKKPKMTAEDFMRAFPVQDFIPADAPDLPSMEVPASSVPEPAGGQESELLHASKQVEEPEMPEETPSTIPIPEVVGPQLKPTSVSAIASAVMALPLFDGDSVLSQKKKPAPSIAKTSKTAKKAGSSKTLNTAPNRPPDPALATFQQKEWSLAYPNSTVNAIQIRSDGSALAKWPNGSVAVSIDRERDGFRCYGAHKDGTIALSFDADGVGFINYYPSGRMMISTSSSGDGLYFSSDGSTILRQWDAELNMKNDKWETTDKLSDDKADGALISKLSEGLGVRLELQRRGEDSTRPCPIRLQICFAAGLPGIRHAFSNWLNASEPNGILCDAVLGKEPVKPKKQATQGAAPTHSDTLQGIRAAVAKLG